MLSFTPSEEQTMLVDAINKYAINDVRKIAHEADESNALPADILRKGWEIGLLPAAIPEQYGGVVEYSAVANVVAGGRIVYGDGGTEGVTFGEREKLMGIHALPTYPVNFSNATVGDACKLGGEAGTRYQRLLSHSRVALAALAVGVARSASEYARNYAKERVAFGVPIASKQAIAFMLAEMAIEVDA